MSGGCNEFQGRGWRCCGRLYRGDEQWREKERQRGDWGWSRVWGAKEETGDKGSERGSVSECRRGTGACVYYGETVEGAVSVRAPGIRVRGPRVRCSVSVQAQLHALPLHIRRVPFATTNKYVNDPVRLRVKFVLKNKRNPSKDKSSEILKNSCKLFCMKWTHTLFLKRSQSEGTPAELLLLCRKDNLPSVIQFRTETRAAGSSRVEGNEIRLTRSSAQVAGRRLLSPLRGSRGAVGASANYFARVLSWRPQPPCTALTDSFSRPTSLSFESRVPSTRTRRSSFYFVSWIYASQ